MKIAVEIEESQHNFEELCLFYMFFLVERLSNSAICPQLPHQKKRNQNPTSKGIAYTVY
jgi:hypothetical protein